METPEVGLYCALKDGKRKRHKEILLTISKTRFGSKSKWPINDCRGQINQHVDHKSIKCNGTIKSLKP